jgi:hypothetical protein
LRIHAAEEVELICCKATMKPVKEAVKAKPKTKSKAKPKAKKKAKPGTKKKLNSQPPFFFLFLRSSFIKTYENAKK